MICQECHGIVPDGPHYHPFLHCEMVKLGHHDPAAYLASYGYTRQPARTDRCPACWGGERAPVCGCPCCDGRARSGCDPVPAKGRQGLWTWDPLAPTTQPR
jgi:hypothetical protein